jgi:hypothetical protein
MHFLQKVHFSRSILGTGAMTGSFLWMAGWRKRWTLGKIGGYRGLPGSALAAGNADNHLFPVPFKGFI